MAAPHHEGKGDPHQGLRRVSVGLAAVLGAVVFVSTAAADKPAKTDFSNEAFSSVLSGVCAFDVNVDSVTSGTEIDYFDKAGNLIKAQVHQVEQDTFTANGKTLTGIPFTFNLDVRFDANGDVVSAVATGLTEKIPLPDGSLFVSAGWHRLCRPPRRDVRALARQGKPGQRRGLLRRPGAVGIDRLPDSPRRKVSGLSPRVSYGIESTILPSCSPASSRSCAARVSASGKTRSTCTRARPLRTSS